jgi:hypothetical protein
MDQRPIDDATMTDVICKRRGRAEKGQKSFVACELLHTKKTQRGARVGTVPRRELL